MSTIYEHVAEIGRCEWCGIVSHELIAGECPACRSKIFQAERAAHSQNRYVKKPSQLVGGRGGR